MAMTPPPPPPGGTPPPPPGGQPPGYPPGGAPPPGYVPFGGPAGPASRTNGFAVASLVLGIVGLLLCFTFIPWILAIIFGVIAMRQCSEDSSYTGRGMAVAGLVLGVIAAALVALIFAFGDFTYTIN